MGKYYHPSSVSGMLRSLGWSTLEDRRREACLTLFYKIVKGEIVVSSEDIHLELADRQTRFSHKFKYKTLSTSTSNISNFVTHKTIKDWNSLPSSVVDADLSCCFKSRLACLRPQAIWATFTLIAPPLPLLPEKEVNRLTSENEIEICTCHLVLMLHMYCWMVSQRTV